MAANLFAVLRHELCLIGSVIYFLTFINCAQVSFEEARNKIEEKVKNVKEGATMAVDRENRQLKRDLEIMEDVNNPVFPL